MCARACVFKVKSGSLQCSVYVHLNIIVCMVLYIYMYVCMYVYKYIYR